MGGGDILQPGGVCLGLIALILTVSTVPGTVCRVQPPTDLHSRLNYESQALTVALYGQLHERECFKLPPCSQRSILTRVDYDSHLAKAMVSSLEPSGMVMELRTVKRSC